MVFESRRRTKNLFQGVPGRVKTRISPMRMRVFLLSGEPAAVSPNSLCCDSSTGKRLLPAKHPIASASLLRHGVVLSFRNSDIARIL